MNRLKNLVSKIPSEVREGITIQRCNDELWRGSVINRTDLNIFLLIESSCLTDIYMTVRLFFDHFKEYHIRVYNRGACTGWIFPFTWGSIVGWKSSAAADDDFFLTIESVLLWTLGDTDDPHVVSHRRSITELEKELEKL